MRRDEVGILSSGTFFIMLPLPLGLASGAISGAAYCAFFFIAVAWIRNNCTCYRKWDIRRIPGVAKLFLKLGFDTHPEFSILLNIHGVKDLGQSGKIYAILSAKYEAFRTRTVPSTKWEQSTRLNIPQGTSELEVSVYMTKLIGSDELVGYATINVARYLLGGMSVEVYGKKRWWKMSKEDGSNSGQVSLTIKKAGETLEDETPLMTGLDPDQRPALYGELLALVEDSEETKAGNVNAPKPGPLTGLDKMTLLAKVLQGKMQRIGRGISGNATAFFAVVEIRPPEDSDDDDEDSEDTPKQKSAKKKWYVAWWDDRQGFLKSPTDPDGFFPILSITAIHSEGAEFIIRYVQKPGNKKVEQRFKPTDKETEVWTDGLDMFREEARELKKKQRNRQEEWSGLSQDQKMTEWMSHYRSQGYTEEELKKYYQQYRLAEMDEAERLRYLAAAAKKQIPEEV